MDFPFEEIMQDALALQPEALSCQRFPGPRMLIGREIQVSDEPSIEGPRAGLDEAQSMVGRIDVAMVEADGLPVVVEAKLHRNRDMAGVIDQALGYARALIASPAEALLRWRAAFGRTAARDPGSPGVFRAVRSINPAWGPDDMLAAMAAHLAAGRCRVVIAADALPEAVVRDAAARRGALGGIVLDLVNIAAAEGRGIAGVFVTDPDTYRCHAPAGDAPGWAEVARHGVEARAVMANLVKDRFYTKKEYAEYRVKRIGHLPEMLWFEAAPGRAPGGDLHQLERSRHEGCAPVMPNLKLLAETGNPYPDDGNHRSVVTDGQFRPCVPVCHATWSLLARQGWIEFGTDQAAGLPLKLAQAASKPYAQMSPVAQDVARNAPLHAMRDCALFGLVRHYRRAFAEHRFELSGQPVGLVPFK